MIKSLESIELIYSLILTILSTLLGEHWILFFLYLLLNIADSFTGWAKAHINKNESSWIALVGVIKKVCYWFLILVAFLIPMAMQELGDIIDIDFSVTVYLGWFVLASLIINECRSILENLVEAGCNVPEILIKGLKVASDKLEGEKQDE
ncbi:phage holin family protein [Allocoprobacillus halotolerans]|uniref:Phage holin family protein n=1 Tax=Allocoprobacillus halotolerans TaxID=2944914 RepID=A0ABY5I6E3_9FIRM|nr:phage holin family protein [Allocoprobacillus halotolerans]UTY39512.1 phage holin family protein [Allocoprobacillus halotolerans]